MANDLAKEAPVDQTGINLSEDWEVRYWMRTFGVSKDELAAAVRKVGNSVEAVRRELQK